MSVNRLDVLVFGTAALAAVVCALFAFQVFFRYQYLRAGPVLTRVDRVSGRTCVMPCLPTPAPRSPQPSPAPPPLDHQEQRAIALVQSNPRAQRLVSAAAGEPYAWSALPAAQAIKSGAERGNSADEGDAFLVCYCDPEGFGLRWEAHLKSAEAYFANDNAMLRERYGARVRDRATGAPSPVIDVAATTIVSEYYQRWNQGDLDTMYGMLSEGYRARHPFGMWSKQHTGVVRISVQAAATSDPLTVAVVVESTDRSGARTVDSEYRGTWTVVRESGTLKLDSVELNQTK